MPGGRNAQLPETALVTASATCNLMLAENFAVLVNKNKIHACT